jgi:hypothetical protein
MSEQKTLNQMFAECNFTTRGNDETSLRIVEKWLTQKRQKEVDTYRYGDIGRCTQAAILLLIDELLEECEK